MKADEARVLSFAEAGRFLGGDTSPETIRTWTKRTKTRAPLLRKVVIGRRSFVLREDLDRLVDAQIDREVAP